jgi:hypothetical protein
MHLTVVQGSFSVSAMRDQTRFESVLPFRVTRWAKVAVSSSKRKKRMYPVFAHKTMMLKRRHSQVGACVQSDAIRVIQVDKWTAHTGGMRKRDNASASTVTLHPNIPREQRELADESSTNGEGTSLVEPSTRQKKRAALAKIIMVSLLLHA